MRAQAKDDPGQCPECGLALRQVTSRTVKHIVSYALARRLEEGLFLHCANPDCDVVYLRMDESGTAPQVAEVFRRRDVKDRVRPFAVGAERLVCYCFGYTTGEIADDARRGRNLIPATIAADVKAGLCACEVMNPGGG